MPPLSSSLPPGASQPAAWRGSLMRRVLIVTPLFPPDAQVGAKRPLRFVRHLRDHGWEPVVLCLPPPLRMNADDDLADAVPEGVEVFRDYAGGLAYSAWRWIMGLGESALGRGVEGNGGDAAGRGRGDAGEGDGDGAWAPPRADSPFAYRILKEVERVGWSILPLDQLAPWLPGAVRAAHRIARPRRVDAVLAIGDPFSAFLVGAALKRSMRLPLVLDLRDPWTIDPAWFSKKVAPLRRLEAFIERTLFAGADGVIFNTSEALRAYRKLYPELAGHMECIPNGFDRSLFRPSPPVVHGGPFTLLHFGNVFGGRSIGPILRAARRLIDRGELGVADLRVVIRGELDPADLAEAARLGLADLVQVRAYRPYREAMIELRGADVLVALEARDLTLQIPAKIYDYLCAERPILSVGQPGEAADLIERLGVGHHFRPEDEDGIAQALGRWLANRHAFSPSLAPSASLSPSGLPPVSPASSPALSPELMSIDDYDAPRQTARLAAALDRAVASAVAS